MNRGVWKKLIIDIDEVVKFISPSNDYIPG
jgi:hypothetical protein